MNPISNNSSKRPLFDDAETSSPKRQRLYEESSSSPENKPKEEIVIDLAADGEGGEIDCHFTTQDTMDIDANPIPKVEIDLATSLKNVFVIKELHTHIFSTLNFQDILNFEDAAKFCKEFTRGAWEERVLALGCGGAWSSSDTMKDKFIQTTVLHNYILCVSKDTKSLLKQYSGIMCRYPSLGAYIWKDRTYLDPSMVQHSLFLLREKAIKNAPKSAGEHLLKGLILWIDFISHPKIKSQMTVAPPPPPPMPPQLQTRAQRGRTPWLVRTAPPQPAIPNGMVAAIQAGAFLSQAKNFEMPKDLDVRLISTQAFRSVSLAIQQDYPGASFFLFKKMRPHIQGSNWFEENLIDLAHQSCEKNDFRAMDYLLQWKLSLPKTIYDSGLHSIPVIRAMVNELMELRNFENAEELCYKLFSAYGNTNLKLPSQLYVAMARIKKALYETNHKMNYLQEAIDYYEKALQISDSAVPKTLEDAGLLNLQAGNLQKAEEYLDRAVARAGDTATKALLLKAAEVKERLGNIAEALDYFKRAANKA